MEAAIHWVSTTLIEVCGTAIVVAGFHIGHRVHIIHKKRCLLCRRPWVSRKHTHVKESENE